METAGDVGRVDERHEGPVIAHAVEAEALAHVAVDIHGIHHGTRHAPTVREGTIAILGEELIPTAGEGYSLSNSQLASISSCAAEVVCPT